MSPLYPTTIQQHQLYPTTIVKHTNTITHIQHYVNITHRHSTLATSPVHQIQNILLTLRA